MQGEFLIVTTLGGMFIYRIGLGIEPGCWVLTPDRRLALPPYCALSGIKGVWGYGYYLNTVHTTVGVRVGVSTTSVHPTVLVGSIESELLLAGIDRYGSGVREDKRLTCHIIFYCALDLIFYY